MSNTNKTPSDIAKQYVSTPGNVQDALGSYLMWLSWHPGDYEGATQFAGDCLDTPEEVDALTAVIYKLA